MRRGEGSRALVLWATLVREGKSETFSELGRGSKASIATARAELFSLTPNTVEEPWEKKNKQWGTYSLRLTHIERGETFGGKTGD